MLHDIWLSTLAFGCDRSEKKPTCVPDAQRPTPSSEADCKAKGGTRARFGVLNALECDLPTSDEGKACVDGCE